MNKEDSEQKNPDIFIIENSPLTQKSKNLKEKKTTKITSPTPKKLKKKVNFSNSKEIGKDKEKEKEKNFLLKSTKKNKIQSLLPKSEKNEELNINQEQREEGQISPTNSKEKENNIKENKEKRNWKSWSPQEKILFYEIIANGGNYTSLQKLFKTMNDVSKIFLLIKFFLIQKIGTKSTEKIRDFYYRMLKKVNILLKKAGDTSVNIRNRDEVIAAISCYGKLLKNNSQKNVRKNKL